GVGTWLLISIMPKANPFRCFVLAWILVSACHSRTLHFGHTILLVSPVATAITPWRTGILVLSAIIMSMIGKLSATVNFSAFPALILTNYPVRIFSSRYWNGICPP